jgi:hypothetical protein
VSGSTRVKIVWSVLVATFALLCGAATAAVRTLSVSYNPNPTGPTFNPGPAYPIAIATVSYDDQAGTISLAESGALTYPDDPNAPTFPQAAEWSSINGLTFSHCNNTPGSAVSTARTDPIFPEAFYDSNGNVSVDPLDASLTDDHIAGSLPSSTPTLSDGGSTMTTTWSSQLLANQNFTCVRFGPGGFPYGQPPYSGGVSFSEGIYYFTGYGPLPKAVYINCRPSPGSRAFSTFVPRQHPRSCDIWGEPEDLADLLPLRQAHWSNWGSASTVATGRVLNTHPGMGGPKSLATRVRLFRVRPGCHGRLYYTRAQVTVSNFATVAPPLHVTPTCTPIPVFSTRSGREVRP